MSFLRSTVSKAMLGATLAFAAMTAAEADQSLKIDVFNPGAKSLFPVASTLVTGPTEAILIDAQFQRDDALSVLEMIRESGKDLKTIYISHGDPDFYFGLDVITDAYPDAKVVASPSTLAHIEETIEGKVSYWGPILGENAPKKTVVPETIDGDTLMVDGKKLQIVGLNGHDPKHTYVWISSEKTVTGGVLLYEGIHVWMADAQTQEARDKWRQSLANLLELNPDRIIPGHVIGESNENAEAINFTLDYVATFEEEAAKAQNASELIEAMKARYPDFENVADLELSAKVIMKEMQWP